MITIKATGDTILHTAGKYCEEDILVKVPEAGGDITPKVSGFTLVIGDDVTEVPSECFYGYQSLTNIEIGNNVTSIGESAFEQCFYLTSATIGDSVTSIDSQAFSCCQSLTNVVIGESVARIGNMVFYSCESLTGIVIPDSVTSIGSWAFQGCTSLTSIDIPDSVKSIGDCAFDGTCICDITIGSGITEIDHGAFQSNPYITTLKIKAAIPPKLGDNCFRFALAPVNDGGEPKIFVPYTSLNQYKNATYWSEYADYMIGSGEGLSYFCMEAMGGDCFYFTFEEGMTWRQFVNSEYNINNEFELTNMGGVLMWKRTDYPISYFNDVNVDSIIEPESFICYTNEGGLEM